MDHGRQVFDSVYELNINSSTECVSQKLSKAQTVEKFANEKVWPQEQKSKDGYFSRQDWPPIQSPPNWQLAVKATADSEGFHATAFNRPSLRSWKLAVDHAGAVEQGVISRHKVLEE